MSHQHHVPLGTLVLTALSGVLIAIQSRANGQLAHTLNNGMEASLISFGSGFAVLMVGAAFSSRLRAGLKAIAAAARGRVLPRWQLLAGMGGGTFVLVQVHAVPLVGVALFSVGTIAGQSAASIIVDRLGIRSGVRHHITPRRVITAAISVAAVAVSVADRVEDGSHWVTILALLAGAVVAVQRAANAHITDFSQHSYATTWLNFATGTSMLVFMSFFTGGVMVAPPLAASSWWMYSGGTLGVIYIAMAAVAVQRLGVLMFTAIGIGGQLVGSLVIDLLFPTPGVSIGLNLYVGIALSLTAVVIGGVRLKRPSLEPAHHDPEQQ